MKSCHNLLAMACVRAGTEWGIICFGAWAYAPLRRYGFAQVGTCANVHASGDGVGCKRGSWSWLPAGTSYLVHCLRASEPSLALAT